MKFLVLALLFPMYSNLYADTETIFLGGGGDPSGPTTIFDGSINALAAKKSEVGLNLRVSFNGGHSTTESLVTSKLGVPEEPFTVTNYQKIIDEYIQKIKNGQIKSGDKLLVMLNTHGGEKSKEYSTHSIATSGTILKNMSQVSGSGSSSVDELKDLVDMAKARGIKLGIIDFSCHSGNSISLANDNTCVISSSGAKHFGYTLFAEQFIGNMAKGKSLEDIFLKVRSTYDLPSFPEISTNAGKKVSEDLYSLFSPYFDGVSADGKANKLTPYLQNIFDGSNLCSRENDFARLIAKMEQLKSITGRLKSRYAGREDLIEILKKYKAKQDEYINRLQELGYPLMKNKERIVFKSENTNKNGTPKTQTDDVTWGDIISGYPMSNLDYFRNNLAKEKNPINKLGDLSVIDKYEKIDQVRQRILKDYPHIKESVDFFANLKNDSENFWKLSSGIAELANKAYDQEYKAAAAEDADKPNPCKDFVL